MSLYNSTSMDGLPPDQQARKAILHILNRIVDHPEIGYYIGLGTESFALLTEAFATLSGHEVGETRKRYLPINARNPHEAEHSRPDTTLVDDRFIKAMERELVANQNKGDWREWHPDKMTCVLEIFHHARKLRHALNQCDKDLVTEHAADLANIAMKTADQLGNLDQE